MHDYSVEPIDKFGRSFHSPIITARDQHKMRSAMSFAEARTMRLREEEPRKLPPAEEPRKAHGCCEIHHSGLVYAEDGTTVCEEAADGCVRRAVEQHGKSTQRKCVIRRLSKEIVEPPRL
jgi:hypothetical protein